MKTDEVFLNSNLLLPLVLKLITDTELLHGED